MWLNDAAQGTAPGTTPASGDWVTNLTASLAPLATSIIQGIDQQKLLDYNLKLIAAGKPPLTAEQLAALQSSSAAQVNVGLGSETQTLLKDALLGGGLLVGAFLLVRLLSDGGHSRRRAYA